MTVTGRVTTGAGLLCAVLVVALAYHLVQLRWLVGVNRNLASVTFRAATVSLELARRIDLLDEYVRKLFVTRDSAYAEPAVEARESAAVSLRELTTLRLSREEEEAVGRIRAAWRSLPLARAVVPDLVAATEAPDRDETLQRFTAALQRLRAAVEASSAASQRAIAEQVIASTQAGEEATRVSLVVAMAAVALAAVAVTVLVRSIVAPLAVLMRGTAAVAAGTFTTQLAVRGRDEFARLSEAFNTMVRRLGELETLKRDFVSHVSHELKTPLVAMQETTSLLLEGAPGPLEAKQRRLLELNLDGARRLSRMIANLLDISRLEAGAMEYRMRPCGLATLLQGAASELEVLARARRVSLQVAVEPPSLAALCDRDRIVQVTQNLIDNALRHSPEATTVLLTAAPAAAGTPVRAAGPASAAADRVVVAVSDRGPGIPAAERGRVFERFRQLPVGRKGSVGLGLAICRQIVEAHGGEIWAEENPGGGSVFAFTLALAAAPGESS